MECRTVKKEKTEQIRTGTNKLINRALCDDGSDLEWHHNTHSMGNDTVKSLCLCKARNPRNKLS